MIRHSIDGAVFTITIDDPERRNALSNDAMNEISMSLRAACSDTDVRVVVLTGVGERVFCAGGDLSGGFVDARRFPGTETAVRSPI